jgi:hypothetical protein
MTGWHALVLSTRLVAPFQPSRLPWPARFHLATSARGPLVARNFEAFERSSRRQEPEVIARLDFPRQAALSAQFGRCLGLFHLFSPILPFRPCGTGCGCCRRNGSIRRSSGVWVRAIGYYPQHVVGWVGMPIRPLRSSAPCVSSPKIRPRPVLVPVSGLAVRRARHGLLGAHNFD